jgi:hypothetical protein
MNTKSAGPAGSKRLPVLPYFLGFVFLLFVAILVFAYLETRKLNPVILDEKGAPR